MSPTDKLKRVALRIGMLPRILARPLNEDLDALAQEPLVVFLANAVLHRQYLVSSPPLHVFQHVVREQLRPFRSRPLAVLEDKAVLEPAFTDQLNCLLKIVLRLTAKADYEIARDRVT